MRQKTRVALRFRLVQTQDLPDQNTALVLSEYVLCAFVTVSIYLAPQLAKKPPDQTTNRPA